MEFTTELPVKAFQEKEEGKQICVIAPSEWLAKQLRLACPGKENVTWVVWRKDDTGCPRGLSPDTLFLLYTDELPDKVLPDVVIPLLMTVKTIRIIVHYAKEADLIKKMRALSEIKGFSSHK